MRYIGSELCCNGLVHPLADVKPLFLGVDLDGPVKRGVEVANQGTLVEFSHG